MKSAVEIFSENLNFYFKQKNVAQLEFASYLDVSMSTVSEWLNGKKSPRFQKLSAICSFLGVEYTDMFIDRSEPRKELTPTERDIIERYQSLPNNGKKKVSIYIDDMAVVYEKEIK